MKKLFLMRHARTEFGNNISDFDRRLVDRGLTDCKKAADFVRSKTEFPELILTSSALRTKSTADNFLFYLNKKITSVALDELYRAESWVILDEVSKVDDKIEKLMIIAHNPGIEELCNELIKSYQSENTIKIKSGVPQGSIAFFSFPLATSWRDLKIADNELHWFFIP